MSVNQKLILAFSLSVAIIVLIGGGAYVNTLKLIEANAWSNHTRQVINALQQIQINGENIAASTRGYVITGQDEYLEPYRSTKGQMEESIRTVRELTADNPGQGQRLTVLDGVVEAQAALTAEIIATRQKAGLAAAQSLSGADRDKKVMDNLRRAVAVMIAEEERLLAVRSAASHSSADFAELFAALSAAIGLVMVGGISFAIGRTISSALSALLETVTALSSGASEQMAAVTQTMSTLEEIKATSGQTLQKSNSLGDASLRTREEAQRGLEVVRRSTEAMSLVRTGVGTIAEMNLALSDQTRQIGDITQVVAKLAQESKMLALNASIEAVKAGEAGKGFSVVASAIRKLAEQSEEATAQVQKILTDIRTATDRAVMATEEGTKQVDQVVRLAEQSGETIGVLNEVIREAEVATQQIALSVQQENIAISQIAGAMTDIRTGIGQFAKASDTTRSVVQRLTGRQDRGGFQLGHPIPGHV